jgi:hypothetical protein
MELGCLIVCYCLLSQQSPPRSPVPPARDESPTAGPLVPVEQRKPKLTPPRLVAEALAAPEQDPLAGRPVPLLEVLSRSGPRPRQLAAVQSYWSLACAVGEYHFLRREQELLTALAESAARGRRSTDKLVGSVLSAELALGSARLKEAELRVIAAQGELADRMGLAGADRSPLPTDEPHVGGYRTHFNVFFAVRPAPARLQLIERTLPLRCKAIDVRAEAVQAASDSLDAAQDAAGRGEIGVEQAVQRLGHLGRQRKAFLEAVRLYNHEIAEYALGVADPNAAPAVIQPMLIKPKESSTPPPARQNSAATGGGDAVDAESTVRPAPGMRSLLKSNTQDAKGGETRLKPTEGSELAQAAIPDSASMDYESYAALLPLSPPKRTHRLTRLLHWDRSTTGAEPALTLEQCLERVAASERRRGIEAYWQAREQAARCQVISDQNDQLAALYPVVLQAAKRSGGPEAMLDLRAQQQSAEADLLDSQALLWVRRLELATLFGRGSIAKDWPMPVTPPHGGRYETRLESQPAALAQSPVVQGLAAWVPGLYQALEDRAEAIVTFDIERAASIEELDNSQQRIDLREPLDRIDRQASETLIFLATLTRYNLAIADYALAILPPGVQPPELASSLIIRAK